MGLLLPNGEPPSSVKAGSTNIRRVYRGSESLWSNWSPNELNSLLIWLDFSANSTITTIGTGNAVDEVADKSGNGYKAIDSPLTPYTNTTKLNGMNVLDVATQRGLVSSYNDVLNMQDVYVVGKWTGSSNFNTYNGLFQGKSGAGTAFGDGIRGMQQTGHLKGNAQWFDNLYLNGVSRTKGSSGHYENLLSTMSSDFIISVSANSSIGVNGYRVSGQSSSTDRGWTGYVAEILAFSAKLSDDDREKVEGYLAHRWGISSVLPSAHTYKSTPPASKIYWDPYEITTTAWYDAADTSTITTSSGGNDVTQMNDKSSNGYDLTVITSNKVGPDYGTRTLNGLNVLEYSKTSTTSNVILEHNGFNQTQPIILTMLVHLDDEGLVTGEQDFLISFTEQQNPRLSIRRTTSNAFQVLSNNGSVGSASGTVTEPGEYLVTVYFNTSNTSLRINGSYNNSGSVANNTLVNINLGGEFNENQCLDGFIAEAVFYSNNADILAVEGYMAHKWGVTNLLPSNHIYKSTRPTIS